MLLGTKLAAVLGVAGLALTATLAAAGSASAAMGDNGDVKIHDQDTPAGDQRDDPKVCNPYLVGFNFDPGQQIEWRIQSGPPFGQPDEGVLSGTLTAGPDGVAQSDNITTLEEGGMYKLWWNFAGEKGKKKSKVFTVECAPSTTSPPPPSPLPNPEADVTEVCQSDDGVGVLLELTNEGGEATATFEVIANGDPLDGSIAVDPNATEEQFISLPNGEPYQIDVTETTTEIGWQFTGTLECEEQSESPTPPTTPPGEQSAPAGGGAPPPGGELPKTGAGFPVGTAGLLAVFLLAAGGALLTSRGVTQLPHRRRH